MGGRGASKGGTGGGGNATQAQQDPLEKYIGKKGTPISVADALKGTNPNLTQKGDFSRKWTHNCQRCVWAFEAQRRGYDVEARARTSNNNYASMDQRLKESFLNVATNLKPKLVGSWLSTPKAKDLTAQILAYGEGTRGMIIGVRGSGGGHVFNWEVENGKVKFYDGQTGTSGMTPGQITAKYKGAIYTERLDDKTFTENIKKFVKKRGDTSVE